MVYLLLIRYFLCVDKNGSAPHRLDALAESVNLPQYLIDMHIDDELSPLFISYNPAFFYCPQYIQFELNN